MTQHRLSLAAVSVAALLAFPIVAVAQVPIQPPVGVAFPRDHPPVIIEGDAGWAAHPEFPGSGTAADPYVIEGWLFAVPSGPFLWAATQDVHQANVGVGTGVIQLYNTNAHVVIRHNLFAAEGTSGLLSQSTHSIALLPANNVSIESNEFNMTGSYADTIVGSGNGIILRGNTFTGDTYLSLAGALDVSQNVGGSVALTLRPGSTVIGNTFNQLSVQSPSRETGAATVSDNHLDFLNVNWKSGELLLSGNDVQQDSYDYCGVSVNTTHVELRGNRFAACDLWLTPDAPIAIASGNTYSGQPILQLYDLHDTTVDLANAPLGWFQIAKATNVTLRGVNVVEATGWHGGSSERVDHVTILDSALGNANFHRSSNLSFQNVTAGDLRVDASGQLLLDHIAASTIAAYGPEWPVGGPHAAIIRDSSAKSIVVFDVSVLVERAVFTAPDILYGEPSLSVQSSDATVRDCSFVPGWVGLNANGIVDARQNWWGSASGPSVKTNPNGTGASIVAAGGSQVLYDPWLTSAP